MINDPILEKLRNLLKQPTEERSHFYVASVVKEAIERIELLQMPPNKVIEMAEADYVDSVALMNALMKKIEGQRKHINALKQQRHMKPVPSDKELPDWDECQRKAIARETMTELETFVFNHEPAGLKDDEWREQLAAVIREAKS